MSKIMQAALDPSCLMCLTPQGWYSPLRPGVIWPTGVSTGPSYPERLGLVTLTNVTNTGAHWEAANPALPAYIRTVLTPVSTDSLTVIWRGRFHAPTGTTVQYAQTCFSFGGVADANIWLCMARTGTTVLQAYVRTATTNIGTVQFDVGSLVGEEIAVAMGYDLTGHVVKMYVNGTIVASMADSRITSLYFARALSIGDATNAYDMPETKFLMTFNNALTAEQIAYLSN